MKTILVSQKKVDDVAGLYYDLVEREFDLENVGVDKSGTHVFLNDLEEKDPTPVVEAWVGKPVATLTRSLFERRKELEAVAQERRARRTVLAAAASQEAQRKEAMDRVAAMALPAPAPVPPKALPPAPPPVKESLISKVFRKMW